MYGGGHTAILTKCLFLFMVDKRPEHGTILPNITLVEADDISKEILTDLLSFTVVFTLLKDAENPEQLNNHCIHCWLKRREEEKTH